MIRTDFVSNSSSSSFMIDEESYNKCDVIIPDSLNPYTTTFYGFINSYAPMQAASLFLSLPSLSIGSAYRGLAFPMAGEDSDRW